MKIYELTYIISSAITLKEADALTKEVETFIQNKEGMVLKSERTAAQTLSYPIKKQNSGYFVILTFQILEDKIKEIKEKLEKDIKILRHFIIVKRPIKEMKERRTRKPMFALEKESFEKMPFAKTAEDKEKNKEESVKIEDIDKKLDEILNE